MKRLSPSFIGLFIVGAVALFVISIVLFSSGLHFGKNHTFVLYFNESVNGLDIGAPVKLRGVRVGQVRQIATKYDSTRHRVRVPVTIRLEDTYFRMAKKAIASQAKSRGSARHQADAASGKNAAALLPPSGLPMVYGLIGSIQTESFVTGKLFIDLNYEELDTDRYPTRDENGILEIPTKPNNLQNISEQVMTIVEGLSNIDYAAIGTLMQRICNHFAAIPFSDMCNSIHGAILGVLNAFHGTAVHVQGLSDGISQEANLAIRNFALAFGELAGTLRRLQAVIGEGAALPENVEYFLRSVGSAASALRFFLEFLERNPNALLTGKYREECK
jgi:paraquat-inducible protein B